MSRLGSRWSVAAVIAVALAIALHSVSAGFITDDHAFRVFAHSTTDRAPAAWDLFRFSGGDPDTNALAIRFGHTPWWTAPDFRIHFARPLTSLLFALDVRVFDDEPLGYHLHSIAWFAAFLVVAAACLRRMLPPAAATIALAVFAWHAGLSQAYAWPSARHVLVAGVPALLSLYFRLRGHRWWSLALFVVALGGGEMALAIVPFLLAYEVAGARASVAGWHEAVVASWRHTVPVSAVALAYLVVYHLMGFGAAGGGGYTDPIGDPGGFARVVVPHLFALLGDALVDVPAELSVGDHELVLAAIGAVATVVVVSLWWRARTQSPASGAEAPATATESRAGSSASRAESRTESSATRVESLTLPADSLVSQTEPPHVPSLGWAIVGALGATFVATTGIPGGRVLAIAELGYAAVLGWLMITALEQRVRLPARIAIGVLALVHLVGSPLRAWLDIDLLAQRGRGAEIVARDALELARGRRLFVIGASDPFVFLYPRGVAADLEPGGIRCWSVISAARTAHRIARIDDHSFSVTALHRPMLAGFDALFRRRDRPLAIGDSAEQCGASIRVTGLTDGLPSAVTVTLSRRLDDPELVFATWRDGRLVPLDLRGAIDIPWSPGPGRFL